jgi:hypothetical protein
LSKLRQTVILAAEVRGTATTLGAVVVQSARE